MDNNQLAAVIAICIAVVACAKFAAQVLQLRQRTENVKAAGWPPLYLDADGDHHMDYVDENDLEAMRIAASKAAA